MQRRTVKYIRGTGEVLPEMKQDGNEMFFGPGLHRFPERKPFLLGN